MEVEKVLRWAMPAVQTVVSAVLLFLLISSGLLPGKYMGIAAAAVAVLLLITILFARSKSGASRSLGNILAIFMSSMLLFAVVYVRHIMRTLDQIAGADLVQTNSLVVLVPNGSEANAAADTAGYKFGVYEGTDQALLDETSEAIKAENGDEELISQSYDSPVAMG